MTIDATPTAFVAELTRVQKVTEAALTTFSRASIAPTSVLTGICTGTIGLAACFVYGIGHPDYAYAILNICSFVGCGALGMLTSRSFGPAKQREIEEQRRIDFNYSFQALAIQTETLKALSGTISEPALNALASKAALTFNDLRTVAQGEEPAREQVRLPSLP